MIRYFRISSVFLVLQTLAVGVQAAGKGLKPEKGEKRLEAKAQEQVIAKIKSTFDKNPCVRAKVVKEVEDPLGLMPTEERGELLVKRPDKVLRRFLKKGKSFKAVVLSGQFSKSFNASSKLVTVKDYARAPKWLALVRAGGTGDVSTLQKYYDVVVFEKDGPKGKLWRLVLNHRKGPLPYKRLQARIGEGDVMFSEIKYEYKNQADGDNKTERFTSIQAVKDIADKEFDDPLFKGAKTKVEKIEEMKDE